MKLLRIAWMKTIMSHGTNCPRILSVLLVLIGFVLPLDAVNLDVNVLSASTRTQLTNVTVAVQAGEKILSTNGPASGSIRIEVPAVVAPIKVTASAPGYSPMRTSISSEETAGTNVTLLLPAAQTIGGRVIEEGTSR